MSELPVELNDTLRAACKAGAFILSRREQGDGYYALDPDDADRLEQLQREHGPEYPVPALIIHRVLTDAEVTEVAAEMRRLRRQWAAEAEGRTKP